ncbi:MAG: aminotransferase class V-fold PLP-dependent enzyme, partial [Planctomycetota bacterium]
MDVIYLDNAATSWPKPPEVGAAMARFLERDAGNPGRGGHRMARAAGDVVERVRIKLAQRVGARDSRRLIMTHGCTDAVNMAIHGVVRAAQRCPKTSNPHVVTTVTEHNAVLRTLGCHAKSGDIDLDIVSCDEVGYIDPARFLDACRPSTVLACVTHASNVLGTIQ